MMALVHCSHTYETCMCLCRSPLYSGSTVEVLLRPPVVTLELLIPLFLALVYMPHVVLMVMYVFHAYDHMICKFAFYLSFDVVLMSGHLQDPLCLS